MITPISYLSGFGLVARKLFGDEQKRSGQGEEKYAVLFSAENHLTRSDDGSRPEIE